ncbi:MAG: NAD(P)H-hydrate epimerase, partial [bacterium]
MKILSTEQMRALDKHCIDDLMISGIMLMERAGQAVANMATAMHNNPSQFAIVLCGKRNNGGDGLVAARILQARGWMVLAILPFEPGILSPDALAMFARAMGDRVPIRTSVTDEELAEADIVIDALLGTGIDGPVRGEAAELIYRVNAIRNGNGVLAVDIPSGVDGD